MSIVVEKIMFYSKYLLIIMICCGLCLGGEEETQSDNRSLIGKNSSVDENKECICTETLNLNLSNMGLRKIFDGFISSAAVTHLDLEDNEIEEGSFETFEKLPNLRYLNLAGNKLNLSTFLESGVHENLDTLILDRMQFLQTPTYYYESNPDIPYFNSFEIGIKLPKLSHLHLEDLQLGSIPSTNITPVLPSLTHLYFSGNDLKHTVNQFLLEIPSTIRHLYIERSEIESIEFKYDKGFILESNTDSLITLSLDENKINCLGLMWPSSIYDPMTYYPLQAECNNTDLSQFKNLEFLSISNNEIFHLFGNAFKQNTKLVSLNLSKNRISDISERISNLHNLEILDLSGNQLKRVSGICELNNLKNLHLDRNLITDINSESICSSETLKSLSLSGNGIETIPAGTFNNLKNLLELNLSENKLTKFDCQSANLKNLVLSGNQFRSMEDILLANQTFLHLLDITNNPVNESLPFLMKFFFEKRMKNNVKRLKF